MESAKGLIVPILNDYVLSPEVYYGDELTGMYFRTNDDQHGRITFHNLDSLKVSRGEQIPFDDDWEEGKEVSWVFKIPNSKWLHGRYKYEKEVYGSSYEFGGNVDEMLTDFNHFVFQFHDEFVEVLAKGFWWEKDEESLFKKPLQHGHPFLPLEEEEVKTLELYGIKCKVIFNELNVDTLVSNAEFCQQKLMEFQLELDGKYSITQTLSIFYREGKIFSSLKGFLGKPEFEKEGVATYDDVLSSFVKYVSEVSTRRKKMNK
jgi:hypothetical protein